MVRPVGQRALCSSILTIMVALPGLALAQSESCTPVTTSTGGLSGAVIVGSKMQEADKGLPKHCIVMGKVGERTGADGKAYAIQFEMRLPAEWNGRFLHQVNGGNDGVVVPALVVSFQ